MNGAPDRSAPRLLLERVRRRVQTLQARMRYRLGLPCPRPAPVTIDERFRHPIDVARKALLVTRYRELFPEAIERDLAAARELAAHRVTLLGHTTDHGPRIAWSRDPVSGRSWSDGFSPDIPYRGPGRLGDIKLPWELNKHQYFVTLGAASWIGDDPGLAREIVAQIEAWIDDNPCDRGIHWISALETGTRATSWILAYPFYADVVDASVRPRLLQSMAQHLTFVERHLSTGPFANTHLVGEAAALVVGGLFLRGRASERWLHQGLAILDEEIARQVTADGVHAEQSVAYHRFFLDHYYLVAALLAANGRALPPATLAGMERMTAFLLHVLFPDGTAPSCGDGDDARGLWMRADAPSDYRGLLALGAVLFNRGDFKAAAGRVTEEVLWLLGPEGVDAFEKIAPRPPDRTSEAYPDAGYYVMRGGWEAGAPVLVFDCGPLGFGPAGHGHADALSVQLHASGYTFLVDPGTYSYNLDYTWRDIFRGTRAHNTVCVDGEGQSVPGDRMSWKTAARARLRAWSTTPWFDVVDGEHDGYQRLADPVTHRRTVIFLKPDIWIVRDDLQAREKHAVESRLHVRPDCGLESIAGGMRLISPAGQRLHAWMSWRGGEPAAVEIVGPGAGPARDADPARGAWFSPGYGVRLSSRALRVARDIDGADCLITCLAVREETRPLVSVDDGILQVTVTRAEGSADRLCCSTGGVWTSAAEGIRFDGLAFFERRHGRERQLLAASRVRELSIDGLLDVRGSDVVDLLLQDDRCDLTMGKASAGALEIRVREGLQVTVNGQPHPAATFAAAR